jgi:hypothetical protein
LAKQLKGKKQRIRAANRFGVQNTVENEQGRV